MEAIKAQTIVSVSEINVDTHAETYSTASRAVNAAVEVFAVNEGQAYIPSDLCPREVLCGALRTISSTFNLDISPELDLTSRDTLHRILQAHFDTDTQAFLEQDSSEIFSHLSCAEKSRILAQSIGATTIIFRRLAETGRTINYGLFNRESQLFAESEQRTLMHDAIEESQVFEDCHFKSQVSALILEAIEAEESEATPHPFASDDSLDFTLSPTAVHERPKNMGQPWGFTIMTIN
ncbi:hypothetical protein G7046_g688 [Stylonectria norvegica]|nr:hypothetical protein G7046_g688 [Stylonectria norvegica]